MARNRRRERIRKRKVIAMASNIDRDDSPTMHMASVNPGGSSNATLAIAGIDWLRDSLQLVRADNVLSDSARYVVLFGGHQFYVTVQAEGKSFRMTDLRW